MKKIIFTLCIVMVGMFLFAYQTPIISESEAISYALETVKNPPSESKFDEAAVHTIQTTNIETTITPRLDNT